MVFLVELIRIIKRPTLLLSYGIAWMITNGHAYVLWGVGMALDIQWMKWYGGTYVTVLWIPATFEKVITIPLAFIIEKQIFQIGRNNRWLTGEIDRERMRLFKLIKKERKDEKVK